MLGSIETLSVSDVIQREHPICTLIIGSYPNRVTHQKSEQNSAFCTIYMNAGLQGRFHHSQTIDHSIKCEVDNLSNTNHPGTYETYRQIGTINVKTGLPQITELYRSLAETHSHISLRRKWMVGAFYLITAINSDLRSYSYKTILGVAPDVPNGTGKVAITASSWKPISSDLESLLAK